MFPTPAAPAAAPAWRLVRAGPGWCALVLGISLTWILALPGTAEAHAGDDEGASNYRTTVIGLRPAGQDQPAGGTPARIDLIGTFVEFEAVENGSRLRLTVRGDHTVLVDGYEDEPYLRLDRAGVWENTRSSAAYLNDTRDGTAVPPSSSVVVDPDTEPRWERIADPEGGEVVALWHDHRAHWMSDAEPAVVRGSPDTTHRIHDWTVPLAVDGQRVDAHGTLDWVPGPSPVPWVVLAVGLSVGVAACGLLRRRWAIPLAVATAGVVAADMTHAVLTAAADAEDPLGAFVWGNTVVAVVWACGLGAAVLIFRRRSVSGLYVAAAVGFVLALAGGFADIGVLHHSGAPVAGPLDITRAATAATVGLGLGMVAAVPLASRRQHPGTAHRPHPAAGGTPESTSAGPTPVGTGPAGTAQPDAAPPDAAPPDAAPPEGGASDSRTPHSAEAVQDKPAHPATSNVDCVTFTPDNSSP